MEILTFISGIASLVALILQIRDIFPEHREIRKTVVILLTGVFAGTLLSSLFTFKSQLASTATTMDVAIYFFLLIISMMAVVFCFSQDARKREELAVYCFIGGIALLAMFFYNSQGPSCDNKKYSLTDDLYMDEIIKLAEDNAERGNYERAIIFIEKIIPPLRVHKSADKKFELVKDPRTQVLRDKIEEWKRKQVKIK